MHVITYSLRENRADSDQYYIDSALFADEVLNESHNIIGPMVESYRSYISENTSEQLLSHEEYILELLILGVLWKTYSSDALGLEKLPRQVLTALANFRRQGGRLKPGIDFLRGILSTIFLSPDLYDNVSSLSPMISHLEKLLDWLDATGEFRHEVKRLRYWLKFLKTSSNLDAANTLAAAITLAEWFEERSEEVLGHYTPNVDCFLNEIRPSHYWHEDIIFCGRRRVEYHLNMVGAEIMNRAFRKAFLNTRKKMVVLPACICLSGREKCKAVPDGSSLCCTGCSPGCRVNLLTGMGKKYGFDVVIIPHESSLYAKWSKSSGVNKDTGVVGIACVLNLISGGLMLKEADIPAQCVLLDYCGCKKHWHSEGFPTDININYLKNILGI